MSPSTAACSCEAALDKDGHIHVCTGSFEVAVCSQFWCEDGTVRPMRCPAIEVRLCCNMPARGLYSQLYGDCTHPNCEAGFRAQCSDFGGTVFEGSCDSPEVPDDPSTDLGSDHFCAVRAAGAPRSAGSAAWLCLGLGLALALRRRDRA